MKFTHFVLTRFNIPFMMHSNVSLVTDTKYLQNRFSLFIDYCFPSLKQQTCQNFSWIVLFDERTPKAFRKINEQLVSEMPNYLPVYIDMEELSTISVHKDYLDEAVRCASLANNKYIADCLEDLTYEDRTSRVLLPQYLCNKINGMLTDDTEYIITTRIDNDDCFHKDMIADIQRRAEESLVDQILNYDNGLQYAAGTNIAQTFYYPNNHFTTIIEPARCCFKTILYWEHFFIDRYKEVVHIDTTPMWMEMVHEGNVTNHMIISKRNHLLFSANLIPFGINKKWRTIASCISLLLHPRLYLYHKIKHLLQHSSEHHNTQN